MVPITESNAASCLFKVDLAGPLTQYRQNIDKYTIWRRILQYCINISSRIGSRNKIAVSYRLFTCVITPTAFVITIETSANIRL